MSAEVGASTAQYQMSLVSHPESSIYIKHKDTAGHTSFYITFDTIVDIKEDRPNGFTASMKTKPASMKSKPASEDVPFSLYMRRLIPEFHLIGIDYELPEYVGKMASTVVA